MSKIPDPWEQYRTSGCTCQVEDAAGYPTIVLYDEDCPMPGHREKAALETKCVVPGCRSDAEEGYDTCRGCRDHFGALAED